MKRLALACLVAAAVGFSAGMCVRLWKDPEARELIITTAHYIARAVTENGMPWRGYGEGWRDGQAAALRK